MISFPQPEQPPEARKERACVIEGDAALAQVAKDAGMREKFSPYSDYIQGKYTFAEEVVTYGFTKGFTWKTVSVRN